MSLDVEKDALYRPEYETFIRKFLSLTTNSVSIGAISSILELLKRSNAVAVLITEPTNEDAKACVQQFLHRKPNIPRSFLPRLIAISSAKIDIMPGISGFYTDSLTVRINTSALYRKTTMTNLSAKTMQEQLKEDIKNAQVHSTSTVTIPYVNRIKINDGMLKQLLNSQYNLYTVIEEGHRNNGKVPDEYIKRQIKQCGIP
jgi:hypothetical protein